MLKRQLILSCALLFLWGGAFSQVHAGKGTSSEDADAQSRGLSAKPLPEAKNLSALKAMVLNKSELTGNRIQAAKLLPKAERNAVLDQIFVRETPSFVLGRLAVATLLFEENLAYIELIEEIVLDKEENVSTRITAATYLPKKNPVRVQALTVLALDEKVDDVERITAATYLPKKNPVRVQALTVLASDKKVDVFVSIVAAKYLPKGNPVRKETLRKLRS